MPGRKALVPLAKPLIIIYICKKNYVISTGQQSIKQTD